MTPPPTEEAITRRQRFIDSLRPALWDQVPWSEDHRFKLFEHWAFWDAIAAKPRSAEILRSWFRRVKAKPTDYSRPLANRFRFLSAIEQQWESALLWWNEQQRKRPPSATDHRAALPGVAGDHEALERRSEPPPELAAAIAENMAKLRRLAGRK